jgi:hypothetical protein
MIVLELLAGRRAALALALASTALPGCAPCGLNGCMGGLQWTARTQDGLPLEAGSYALTIELEDTRWTSTCTIVDPIEDSACSEPERIAGDTEFSVEVKPWSGDEVFVDPGLPVDRFRVEAAEYTDEGDLGSMRGPTSARIVLERDGTVLVDEAYEIEYRRSDEAHGDERCGYCDSLEERTATTF